MNKKIFFTDLDGTLLNDAKKITDKTYQAIQKWLDMGNYLALSSGRPLDSIKEVIEQNSLMHDNLYAIAFNGALIYHPKTGQKLCSKSITANELKIIADIAAKHNIYCHAYDDTYILTPKECDELFFYKKNIHLPHKIIADFPANINESYKMLCICLDSTDKLDKLAADINTVLKDSITCVKSNNNLLEVFSSSSGKGKAVNELCEILAIDVKNSLAAGDEQNDISMILAAGKGIAMLNARDIVKKSADEITKTDNNSDGLMEYFSI